LLNIYTFADKRPDFLKLQLEMFKKHLQEDFVFTVFNNAFQPFPVSMACGQLNLREILVPRMTPELAEVQAMETSCPILGSQGEYANPNVACAYPLYWAWKNIISKQQSRVCILDSDAFLMKDCRLTDYVAQDELCYIPQTRPRVSEYMWNALVLADVPRLPEPETMNWYCGMLNGQCVDVGGQTATYLEAHPELKIRRARTEYHEDDARVPFYPANYEYFLIDESRVFLHYRSGSNWNKKSEEYHRLKTEWLKRQLA